MSSDPSPLARALAVTSHLFDGNISDRTGMAMAAFAGFAGAMVRGEPGVHSTPARDTPPCPPPRPCAPQIFQRFRSGVKPPPSGVAVEAEPATYDLLMGSVSPSCVRGPN